MEYNKNKGIFWLLTLIIILTGYLCIETIINKYSIKEINNNISTTTKKEEITTKQNNIIQSINTNVGKFILFTDGKVYYLMLKYHFNSNQLNNISKKDTYSIPNFKENFTFEGYRLNINNINSLYEINFNNSDIGTTLFMLDKDGKVNTLNITFENNELTFKLKEEINYKNIVSILVNDTDEEKSAILVDKDGNKYNYKNKKNV